MQNIYLRALILILLSGLSYWPALHGGFIWDDVTFIAGNDLIHQPDGLWKIWFTRASTDYWPLTYSLFWIFWRAFGADTVPYHLINLGVHILNCFLLWKILSQLRLRGAYFVALLFAVHPVNVESVAWIFQLKTTLSTFFAFTSLYFWLRFLTSPRRAWLYGGALITLALALLTKASVVLWPFVLLAVVFWKEPRVRFRTVILWLAPFFLVSLLAGGLGLFWYPFTNLSGGEMIRSETLLEKILLSGWAFWFYLSKAFWPEPLIFIYPRWRVDTANPLHYLPVVGAVILWAGFLAIGFRKAWGPFLILAYFLLALIPVLGVTNIYFMRYSFVADHWQYLALPATLVAFVWSLEQVLKRWPNVGAVLLIGIAAIWTGLSFRQAHIFGDEYTIWTDTIKKNPHAWLAQSNLGASLLTGGRLDEALPYLLATVAEKPNYVDAYNNLGAYYLARNDFVQAREQFEIALTMFPNNARAYNNLAVLAMRQGQSERALHLLLSATAAMPDYIPGLKNLAQLYITLGRRAEAADVLKKALRVNPDDEDVAKTLRSLNP